MAARGAEPIDFVRDVRPILIANCLDCHGPDAVLREAELRLDELTNAFERRGERPPAIVRGGRETSELWRRVSSSDPDHIMPPPHTGRRLTEQQIATLGAWLEQGADWPRHWAFTPVARPSVPPALELAGWSRGVIDQFTARALSATGRRPRAEADRGALLRRVTLDLTGVPPTPAELEAFLADRAPDAFERVVDRLLASPRYGEQRATAWLDLARYADTHGYHSDSHRDMWLWRDWVIKALNDNMPFDQFTIEQLAGDLLPDATVSQSIASGFHRNTMLNAEEGAIPEEYLAEYVADRVNTTATVWLGQTLGCARCHDHKYDPFTQRDYYRVFALFHQVSEKGLDGRKGNAAPLVTVMGELPQRQWNAWQARMAEIDRRLTEQRRIAEQRQSEWEPILRARHAARPPADATWYFPLDETEGDTSRDAAATVSAAWNQPITWLGAGKFRGAALLDGTSYLSWKARSATVPTDGFTLSLWLFPTTRDQMTLAVLADASLAKPQVHVELLDGAPVVWFRDDMTSDRWNRWQSDTALELRRWQHVTCSIAPVEAGEPRVRLAVNGQAANGKMEDDAEHELSAEPAAGELWLGGDGENGMRGMLDEVRWYPRVLNSDEVRVLAGSDPIGEILAVAPEQRSPEQREKLLTYYLHEFEPTTAPLAAERATLEQKAAQLRRTLPTTMVMDQVQPPRDTYVLVRGDYQRLGERVQPGVPAFLDFDGADSIDNRLDLARWIVDPRHPLTARVAVNRLWQELMGVGLVRTSEDFGLRGELPSHPELLDWLAAEYVASGWDTKYMVRLIVTSATYRQSVAATVDDYHDDPENRHLARGARPRLPAEVIRDSALLASGLLVERLGGPGVHPYQPPGLWEELAYNQDEYSAQRYVQSHGADLYRRSVYTFWKRTSPPATLATFDAPNREVCVARRARTNTPLQALALMNDPTFVEAARVLAVRVMAEHDPSARLRSLHRHLLGREPDREEAAWLLELFRAARSEFAQRPDDARQLLAVGEAACDERLPPVDVAAWTVVAMAVMNLDEFVTRP